MRAPFWAESLRVPLDGDEAVIGLMSRHLLHSGHIWGQPFGSPLEALLVAPSLAAFGPGIAAFRWPYFLLGLLLAPLAAALAARLHPSAAWPAGLLVACPPPYFLVIASQSTIYPWALVLGGALLLLTLALAERLAGGRALGAWLVAWGAVAGLALWTHLMSGAVGLSPARALLPCAVASAIWYALLIVAGAALGLSWPRVRSLIEDSTRLLGVVGALAAALAVWWIWRRSRR